MPIRDLRVSFPPSDEQQVDTIKLSGERTVFNDISDKTIWQSFSATATIDWERLADHYAKGGRKVLASKAITVDSRIFEPKEVHLD